MNLKNLSDEVLLQNTKAIVRQERELVTRLLHHLRENDRRRLYSKLRYKSLYEYLMKELGYSADESYRRIDAMRVLREIPEIEEKIEMGTLSLTHINLAQKVFRNEPTPLTREEKIEIFQKLENTTTREAERIAIEISSVPFQPIEKIKPVGKEKIEVRFSADAEMENKFERLKGLLAHSNPHLTLSELVNKLCDLGLETWDPAQKKSRAVKTSAAPRIKLSSVQTRTPISVQMKREVWRRDRSQCCKCGSRHALQIDHIRPVALAGDNDLKNLRLLCRACNQRGAIQTFGASQMAMYLQT